jgi:hypothetical protein
VQAPIEGRKEVDGGKEREGKRMEGQGAIEERCGQCQSPVPEDSGYENGRGELLCTECFVDQWGPSTEELALGFGEEHGSLDATQPVGAAPFWTSSDLGGLELS